MLTPVEENEIARLIEAIVDATELTELETRLQVLEERK
jgi:hypothetical protein